MAPLGDFQDKVKAVIDQAKPLVEDAAKAGAQLVEKAGEWAGNERPGVEGAYEAAGNVASGAVEMIADGANAAYEFIKDRIEEVSGKDLDGDGQIGQVRQEDLVAAAELATEAVTDAVDKVAERAASVTPEDIQAGAELAAEAVADAVDKAAAEIATMTPEDVQAGAELAAEAVAIAVDRVTGDVIAGAELAVEVLADAAEKAAETQE